MDIFKFFEGLGKIAIIPLWIGFAYLLAFAYEGGFLYKWKIPIEYLRFNLSVLSVAAATLLFVSLIFALCALAIANGENWLFRLGLAVLVQIVLCVGLVLLYLTDWKDKIWLPIAVFLFSVGVVGLLLVMHKSQNNKFNITVHAPVLMLCVIVLFFSFFTSYAIGRTRAIKQKTFLVPNDRNDLVVLRIYKNNIICAKFENNEIKKEFVVINFDHESEIRLKWEDKFD